MTTPTVQQQQTPGWFSAADCRLDDFRALVEAPTDITAYPHADAVRENVLVYGASADTAAPDSKSVPESKSTLSAPVVAVASAASSRRAEPAPASSEPPPSPKRKAPARKSAKSG